jgi:hypothetical protein
MKWTSKKALLPCLRFYNHFAEGHFQGIGNRLGCIEVGTSLATLQKTDVRLMKPGLFSQGGFAEFSCLTKLFYDFGKGI